MEIGDIVITEDCVSSEDGTASHPAIVTRVWSDTEINCLILVDSPSFNPAVEQHLLHESVQPDGRRFKLKGA